MRWCWHSSYLTTRNRTKDTLISVHQLQSDALPTELWWGDVQAASPNAPLSTMGKQAILNQVNKRFLENPYTTWFQLISQQVPLTRKRWNFHLRLSAKRTLLYFRPNSDLFRTRSGAMCRPCTINVRNDPVQEMFCVVKCETPPVLRWKLCEFQHSLS